MLDILKVIPMVPDPGLQDYVDEGLTFKEIMQLARNLQQYYYQNKSNQSPTGVNLEWTCLKFQSAHLAVGWFLLQLFGNMLRRPGVGQRKMTWYTSADPDVL